MFMKVQRIVFADLFLENSRKISLQRRRVRKLLEIPLGATRSHAALPGFRPAKCSKIVINLGEDKAERVS